MFFTERSFDMGESRSSCGCKGIRSCLVCEKDTESVTNTEHTKVKTFTFCVKCQKAWTDTCHPHRATSLEFPGIWIEENFVSVQEEEELAKEIDEIPWTPSQSGRRKQDFGPKVNFKKQKIKSSVFTGLPPFSEKFVNRMHSFDRLKDFAPVEQCHLEYTPERGAAIDAHFDDFWLWGERLVTLNLLADTSLCMTRDDEPGVEVLVPLLRRSLIVVCGAARYSWKHGIKREHITSRRLAVTLRELSTEFLQGGDRLSEGKQLLDIALTYKGVVVK